MGLIITSIQCYRQYAQFATALSKDLLLFKEKGKILK